MAVSVLFELLVAHAPIPGPSLYYRNCDEPTVADGEFVYFWFLFDSLTVIYNVQRIGQEELSPPFSCRRRGLASELWKYFDIFGRRPRDERFRRFMKNVAALFLKSP